MARCPNCGGNHYKYSLRSAGTTSRTNYYRTGTKNSLLFPSTTRTHRSQRLQKSVAVCADCGYVSGGMTGSNLKFMLLVFVVALAFFYPRYLSHQAEKEEEKKRELTESIWASTYTPLESFNYKIRDGKICLTSYNGEKRVKIAASYNVNGKVLPVVELDGTFALDNIKSVIVPNGVTKMSNNVFNSCGVDYVYLPASLTEFKGWSYFHDLEQLYYGGSEEQFKALYNNDKDPDLSKIDAKEIIFNADITSLK